MSGIQKVLTNDGVSIAFEIFGEGPLPLVALHGWGGAGTGHSWREMIKHLDLTGLRLIALDLRGHGESGRTDQGFTLERLSQDILTVADEAKATQFVILGYSMSGRWAQWITCRYPERVLGQILITPAPATPLPLGEDLLNTWMHDTRDRVNFDAFVHQFTVDRLADDIVNNYFRDVSRASTVAKRATFHLCCRDDFSSQLATTRAPTLVLAGDHDPMLSPEFLRKEIVSRIANARMVRLDCGHEIPVERAAQASGLVEAFVAGLAR